MANHYTILGLTVTSGSTGPTSAEVAQAFRSRALQLHPDKWNNNSNVSSEERRRKMEEYIQLQQAYHVLRHDETRALYDAALASASSSSGGPITCAEVDLDDCGYDEETMIYTYPCRCGAIYQIEEHVLSETGMDLFPCHQCSLVIRIMFEWQPTEDDHTTTTATVASPTNSSSTQTTISSTSSGPAAAINPDEMG